MRGEGTHQQGTVGHLAEDVRPALGWCRGRGEGRGARGGGRGVRGEGRGMRVLTSMAQSDTLLKMFAQPWGTQW